MVPYVGSVAVDEDARRADNILHRSAFQVVTRLIHLLGQKILQQVNGPLTGECVSVSVRVRVRVRVSVSVSVSVCVRVCVLIFK